MLPEEQDLIRLEAEQAELEEQVMYYNGAGVPQNYEEAVKWYQLAAEQGYAAAQEALKKLNIDRMK